MNQDVILTPDQMDEAVKAVLMKKKWGMATVTGIKAGLAREGYAMKGVLCSIRRLYEAGKLMRIDYLGKIKYALNPKD